jgi:fructose-1,6-bisphosphatase I
MDIINILQKCFIEISDLIRFTDSSELGELMEIENKSGDVIKKLDYISNKIFIDNLKECKNVKYIASEEEEDLVIANEDGKYLISFDPVDGSSNIKNNITVGTIFCVFQYNENMSGKDIIMAGYCLYGNSTTLTLCLNNRMNHYILNQNNKFKLINEDYKIPLEGTTYGINESNRNKWSDKNISKLVENFIELGKTQRWVGSLVADAHRVIMTGGSFSYPSDKKNINGKIRLVYEAFPMAYVFYCGGGYSSNGTKSILDLSFPKDDLHKQLPLHLFSKNEFELFKDIKNNT